jgi:hypothetical protein
MGPSQPRRTGEGCLGGLTAPMHSRLHCTTSAKPTSSIKRRGAAYNGNKNSSCRGLLALDSRGMRTRRGDNVSRPLANLHNPDNLPTADNLSNQGAR